MPSRFSIAFSTLPLRYSVPGALLLFTAAVAGWVYFHNVRLTHAQVERDAVASLTLAACRTYVHVSNPTLYNSISRVLIFGEGVLMVHKCPFWRKTG